MPLWCILALELLARATLSRISPALLADQKEENNLLYAFGFPGKAALSSISARLVFQRCTVICEEFSEQERKRCMKWMSWRNEELHTGHMPFENLMTSAWQPDFFRICSVLLNKNETVPENFLGPAHAARATTMVESLSQEERQEAHRLVKEAKEKFLGLEFENRMERLQSGAKTAKKVIEMKPNCKEVRCPSCEGSAFILGDLIRSTTPKEEDGELIQDDVWLPTALACVACELSISGHARVAALGLGNQFVTKDFLDPRDYFNIEDLPAKYYDLG